jgi:hypothetical protein
MAARAEARARANERQWMEDAAAAAARADARRQVMGLVEDLAETWPELAMAVAQEAVLNDLADAVRRSR